MLSSFFKHLRITFKRHDSILSAALVDVVNADILRVKVIILATDLYATVILFVGLVAPLLSFGTILLSLIIEFVVCFLPSLTCRKDFFVVTIVWLLLLIGKDFCLCLLFTLEAASSLTGFVFLALDFSWIYAFCPIRQHLVGYFLGSGEVDVQHVGYALPISLQGFLYLADESLCLGAFRNGLAFLGC